MDSVLHIIYDILNNINCNLLDDTYRNTARKENLLLFPKNDIDEGSKILFLQYTVLQEFIGKSSYKILSRFLLHIK